MIKRQKKRPDSPVLSMVFCTLILLIILTAGLWPFNFFHRNEAAWLRDRPGVSFYGQGAIFGAERWGSEENPLFPDRAMTLEIMLEPSAETSNLPGIAVLHDGASPDLLLIGQWKSHLAIRSRTDNPDKRKRGKPYQEIGLRDGLREGRPVFLAVTSAPEGTSIYQDGRPVRQYPRHHLLGGFHGEPVRLILGNVPNGHSPWKGNLLGMALYNRALPADQVRADFLAWQSGKPAALAAHGGLIGVYSFREGQGTTVHNAANPFFALSIPGLFTPQERVVLECPWNNVRLNGSFVQDVSINILGFIPFGFCFSLLLSQTTGMKKTPRFLIVVAAGITLSLVIELAQVYLPTRNSQLLDVFCNTAGLILGAGLTSGTDSYSITPSRWH